MDVQRCQTHWKRMGAQSYFEKLFKKRKMNECVQTVGQESDSSCQQRVWTIQFPILMGGNAHSFQIISSRHIISCLSTFYLFFNDFRIRRCTSIQVSRKLFSKKLYTKGIWRSINILQLYNFITLWCK